MTKSTFEIAHVADMGELLWVGTTTIVNIIRIDSGPVAAEGDAGDLTKDPCDNLATYKRPDQIEASK